MIDLYVDVSNLYYNTHRTLDGKIDYVKLREFVGGFGKIDTATTYLGFKNNGFEKFLKVNKYKVRHIVAVKRGIYPSSVDITMDVIESAGEGRLTVIISNNSSLFALYRRLHERGNKFLILGVDNADKGEAFIEDNRLELPRSVLI